MSIREEIKSIFQSILCTAFHKLRDFRPFFGPLEFENILKKSSILLYGPRAFLNIGVEKTIPEIGRAHV